MRQQHKKKVNVNSHDDKVKKNTRIILWRRATELCLYGKVTMLLMEWLWNIPRGLNTLYLPSHLDVA